MIPRSKSDTRRQQKVNGDVRAICAPICAYWGSVALNEYAFGGEWPHADFIFQNQICCSHSKWLQVADEIDGGEIPYFCFDVGAAVR